MYLANGAIAAGQDWVIGVLMASGLLNAAYFLPIVYKAWFQEPNQAWPAERTYPRFETHWMLLLPPVFTASLALLVGLFAYAPFSVLEWVRLIAYREYGQ